MAKAKLTKTESKRQKDALKRYQRYLPTLVLKKQQLQIEIQKIEHRMQERIVVLENLTKQFMTWISVFGEVVDFERLISVKQILSEEGNIAGIDIPVFKMIHFEDVEYDLFLYPLWVDMAIEQVKEMLALRADIHFLEIQINLLGDELRITTQRVNLFEKVKIPETKNNIRRITIYLGDQQTAAVVRGKISKKKLVGEA
jgi:V/A-type H+-transporting ATPase subunit D